MEHVSSSFKFGINNNSKPKSLSLSSPSSKLITTFSEEKWKSHSWPDSFGVLADRDLAWDQTDDNEKTWLSSKQFIEPSRNPSNLEQEMMLSCLLRVRNGQVRVLEIQSLAWNHHSPLFLIITRSREICIIMLLNVINISLKEALGHWVRWWVSVEARTWWSHRFPLHRPRRPKFAYGHLLTHGRETKQALINSRRDSFRWSGVHYLEIIMPITIIGPEDGFAQGMHRREFGWYRGRVTPTSNEWISMFGG